MVEELPGIGFLAGALAALLGGVFIIAGLVAFLLAYGFWTGRGWAWILGIIFSIVGIVLGVVSLLGNSASIVGILINILIIYYLTRTHVKEWFGRA
jgi:ABC-type Mn2+/Zn2+ transport system permease subunit